MPYRSIAALLSLLVLACAPAARASDLPKPGKVDMSWFGDNPYAADSSVHAYVIARVEDVDFGFDYNAGTPRRKVGSRGDLYAVDVNARRTARPELRRRLEHRRIVRVLDERGYGQAVVRFAYYDPEGGPDERPVVDAYIHRLVDGEVETESVSRREQFVTRLDDRRMEITFSLPAVAVGSVIDVRVEQSRGPVGYCPPLYLQEAIPVREAEVRVSSHAVLDYQYVVVEVPGLTRTIQTRPYPNGDIGGDQVITTYTATDVAALASAPYVTNVANYRGQVRLELRGITSPGIAAEDYIESWDAVLEELADAPAVRQALKGNSDLDEWATECPADVTSATERFDWALAQVATRISWDGGYTAYPRANLREVLRERKGSSVECNAVLLGLARALGLEARPVYLSTVGYGALYTYLPSNIALDHMIVGVRDGGKTLLADATAPTTYPGVLPDEDLNGDGVALGEDGRAAFLPLQEGASATRLTSATLALGEDGYLSGRAAVTLGGYAARDLVRGSGAGRRLGVDTAGVFGDFAVEGLTVTEQPGYQWLIEADVRSLEPALDLGDARALRPLLQRRFELNPLPDDTRAFPVELPYRILERRNITIRLPEGSRLEEVPQSVALSSPSGGASYRQAYVVEGETVDVSTTFLSKATKYETGEYDGLRGLFAAIIELENGVLGVVPAP